MIRIGRTLSVLLVLAAVTISTVTSAAAAPAGPGAASLQHGLAASAEVMAAAQRAQGASDEELLAADRDFIEKVRLAGLWEMPAGLMAAEKGVNPRVREIGRMIATQHGQLDALAVAAAKKVRVPLPDEPNADQKKWLGEMKIAKGRDFDTVFVHRLRAAHGKIFPAIAYVRTGTKNVVVRQLAQRTNDFVLTHLTLLESTGLVDYAELPEPPEPATGPAPAAAIRAAEGGVGLPVIWLILAVALVAGAIGTSRLVRPRSFGGRTPPPRPRRPGASGVVVLGDPVPIRSDGRKAVRAGRRSLV